LIDNKLQIIENCIFTKPKDNKLQDMLSFKKYHKEFEPPEILKNMIKCFWYDRIDFVEIQTDFEVVPDGYAEIIFHFGSTCSISYNGVLKQLPSPFIIGLLNQPIHFYTKNRLQIIAIRCYPWTVFDLLGLSSGKDLITVLEHPIAQLQSVLNELIKDDKITEAVEVVKHYLLNLLPNIKTNNMLFKAGLAMSDSNGTMPVSRIAEAANATIRTLERKFSKSSGHTVKDVSGLMRFEQVRNQLWLHPDSNLAGLAHELGYTDQSHLSREFKRYSGTTPAVFARKAKKEQHNR